MTTLNNQYLELKQQVDEKTVLNVRHIVQQHVDLANKITRDDLLMKVFRSTGVSADRKLQMVVRELNSRGDPVCPDPVGGGYFWAINDIDLYLDYIARERNRAISILEKTSKMIEAYGEKYGKQKKAELMNRINDKNNPPPEQQLLF